MVILTPESGDGVQIMKAGLIEVADIFVVNKCDRPGAENIAHALKGMLDRIDYRLSWKPPIIKTSASLNKGVDTLYEGLGEHRRYLNCDKKIKQRRQRQIREELKRNIETEFIKTILSDIYNGNDFGKALDNVCEHRIDPQNAARQIVTAWLSKDMQPSEKWAKGV